VKRLEPYFEVERFGVPVGRNNLLLTQIFCVALIPFKARSVDPYLSILLLKAG